eukprot:1855822-Amphidinium_carterae.1
MIPQEHMVEESSLVETDIQFVQGLYLMKQLQLQKVVAQIKLTTYSQIQSSVPNRESRKPFNYTLRLATTMPCFICILLAKHTMERIGTRFNCSEPHSCFSKLRRLQDLVRVNHCMSKAGSGHISLKSSFLARDD